MHDDRFAAAPCRGAQPGEIVTFGSYPQTAAGTDRTPIRWRVLHNSGSALFLLSEYILDAKRYHGEYVDITWHDCDLRQWLNEAFYSAAFNATEQGLVNTTRCTDNGAGSQDTEDKVFLLGVAEVKRLTASHGADIFAARRGAVGTAFAQVNKADGCRLYVYDKSVNDDYLTENGETHGCSWWWLRTQLGCSSRACFIGTRGSVRSYCRVNRVSYGVRPALTLQLQR